MEESEHESVADLSSNVVTSDKSVVAETVDHRALFNRWKFLVLKRRNEAESEGIPVGRWCYTVTLYR